MLIPSQKDSKLKHVSFKQQLLTIFIISIIILTLITAFLTAWQSSRTLRKSTIDNNMQITKNFAEHAVLALLTNSKENAQEAIEQTLEFASVVNLAIYKNNGKVLISSTVTPGTQVNTSTLHIATQTPLVSENDSSWTFIAEVTFLDDVYDEDMVDPNDENLEMQTLGYVLIEFNKDALHQVQRSIFINNLSIGVIVTLILALLIRPILTRMLKPLLDLFQTMETARDSGLYSKASVNGALEIRQMAQVYNQMMSTLEKQNTALEKHRDTLESEVEIRTKELIIARDRALTASRHKSEFLANISHELRTPLQAIIGYTDLVREDLELECMDTQVEDLNKSIKSAHNLLSLINNILDLAKIEAGRMDLYLKPVNIKSLIDETVDTIRPMATTNNNELIVNVGTLLPILTVDRQKLMQIFLNLLSNACKFTKNGSITFNIYNDKHYLHFSIADTGVGIEQNKLNYIFEQFTQVDGSQTRRFEGTGLGMAITQNFCQLMGGKVMVTSKFGIGSTFTVQLPLNKLD